MFKEVVLIVAGAIATFVRAAPVESVRSATCTTPIQRKSWHSLNEDERRSYIAAEKCLMAKPAQLGFPSARTRFDELQIVHVIQTEDVHGVGGFLPFHRYFVHVHEYLLRSECNYTGGQPYWDESIDAGNFSKSIILDSDTGFGGNGTGESNCIADGPFKDYINAIGPGQSNINHCINRIMSDCASQLASKDIVENCALSKTYLDFWNCVEGFPHTAGHGGIGGQMLDVFASPGDPLFYLHHAWLDKLWADWQSVDPSIRHKEIGGTNQGFPIGSFPILPPIPPGGGQPVNGTCPPIPVFPPPGPGFPGPPIPRPFKKIDGDPGNVTTLEHVLMSAGMMSNTTVADVMQVQGDYLCYEYI